jgi:hypothetical protein
VVSANAPERDTVVELAINPPFGGNLLVQASGYASSEEPPDVVSCRPFLGSGSIGEGVITGFEPTVWPQAPVAVTAAATVSAGSPQTVSFQCTQVVLGRLTGVS